MSDLCAQGRLLDAADPKLGNEYNSGEMEKVLIMGLFCSHAEAEKRPGIRQVCQILDGGAPLPDVQTASINVNSFGLCRIGDIECATTANPEDRFLQEIPSGSRSSGWFDSTSVVRGSQSSGWLDSTSVGSNRR